MHQQGRGRFGQGALRATWRYSYQVELPDLRAAKLHVCGSLLHRASQLCLRGAALHTSRPRLQR